MERVGHDGVCDRDLWVVSADGPHDLGRPERFPKPYFACLIAWDATGVSHEVVGAVADHLLRAGCAYICCWGPDCERVHDIFDEMDLQLRPDGPWAMSTWHSREPLGEALWFLLHLAAPDEAYFDGCRAAVGVTIGSADWAAEVRAALARPDEFNARMMAEGE